MVQNKQVINGISAFIVIKPINADPDLDVPNKVDLNAKFEHQQEIMEHFRNRFCEEFSSQLISGANVKEARKLKLEEIFLIGDDNRKRSNWPLARIDKLIEERVRLARIVVLKAKEGKFKRPALG